MMCDCVPETWLVRLRTRPRPVGWRGSEGARDRVTDMPERLYIGARWRLRNAAYQFESWQARLHVCLRGRNADRYRWRYNVVAQPELSWLCFTAAPGRGIQGYSGRAEQSVWTQILICRRAVLRVFLHNLSATSC